MIPKPAGSACAQCPSRDRKCVHPERSLHTRLAIVGEAPGRNELEQGRPFIGASGRMLERGLRTIGLRRSDVHWTNAVLCETPEQDLKAAAKCCGARLRAELGSTAASVIMPVGAYALQSTLGLSKKPQIQKWRGSVSEIRLQDSSATAVEAAAKSHRSGTSDPSAGWPPSGGLTAYVCPTLHPAFIMRPTGAAWRPIVEIDVERIGRVLRNGFTPPENAAGRRMIVARTEELLSESLAALAPGAVAFDVETVGLGPVYTDLVCFALSDGNLTVVIPWSQGRDGRDPWWDHPAKIAERVSDALSSRICVTHNGPAFDHIVAARYGIRIAQWDDTLLGAHALAGHLPKRLAHVVTLYCDVPPWKELEDRTATLERLWTYNGRDTLYTALAHQAQRQAMKEAA